MADRTEGASVSFRLNGKPASVTVEPRLNVADLLRGGFRLTGTHVGCEHGVCGACNVRVDGVVVRGCLMLAIQLDGAEVTTIEGLSDQGVIQDLQSIFIQKNALQCGFCTPGMLMTAAELLAQHPSPSREEIRGAISGNYCRCTGYQAIVDAIEAAAAARASKARTHG